MLVLADVVAAIERHYPPALAEPWDAVGLVCGDPDTTVRRVMFAVDPVAAVADEAIAWGADLLITHHPLFLRPVHGVPATTPKGRLVHELIRHDTALYVAHTNADRANPGVNDALAASLGLGGLRPLVPAEPGSDVGLGRIGTLPTPQTVAELVHRVVASLPATAGGVRATGDPERLLHTVAVCGGAGDSLLDEVRAAGIDAYVTADLRHHPSSESAELGGPAGPVLIDVAHWSSEWPWLPVAAERLRADLADRGATVETRVSSRPTDPWTVHELPTPSDRSASLT